MVSTLLRRLFGFEEPDELLAVLKKVRVFRRLSRFDGLRYPTSYQGMQRIGLFKAYVKESSHGLYAILRVFRTKETPYRYVLAWTFGDREHKDGLLNVLHQTPQAFAAADLKGQLDAILSSMQAMTMLHNFSRMNAPYPEPLCRDSVDVQHDEKNEQNHSGRS